MGVYSILVSTEFPFAIPKSVFAIILDIEGIEAGDHLVGIKLVHERTGELCLNATMGVNLPESLGLDGVGRGMSSVGHLIINLPPFLLKDVGQYTWNVYLDDELMGSSWLKVLAGREDR